MAIVDNPLLSNCKLENWGIALQNVVFRKKKQLLECVGQINLQWVTKNYWDSPNFY